MVMNNKHLKKIIAPVIVVFVIVLYYAIIGTLLFKYNVLNIIKIIALLPPVFAMGGMIYVLVERIKEINGGEEDDLGKY
jgi:hypothetical protein